MLHGDTSTRKGVYGRNWPGAADLRGATSQQLTWYTGGQANAVVTAARDLFAEIASAVNVAERQPSPAAAPHPVQ
jgi:hypothetical protein